MAIITTAHVIGVTFTLLLFIALGIYSGKGVKNADDFDTGGKSANTLLVIGAIVGSLVGGNSTIGTAQLAFSNGLSAWWFTIGASLGCLILAFVFSKPLRESGCSTIQQIISTEYGQTAGVITSVLTSIGVLMNIVAQILAANALLSTLFGFSTGVCVAICVVVMACYVVFGGVKGAGLLGIFKLVFLYASVAAAGTMAWRIGGGIPYFYENLSHTQFFNLFSRGIGIDLGSCFSVGLGVVSSQSYMQAVLSGKTNGDAKKGCIWSAVLIPPIGILSTLVGMFMKVNFADIDSGQAFPLFILNNMPPLFAGIAMATLLIAIVGTGSSMALGFASTVSNDIYKTFINKNASSDKILFVTRVLIIISLLVSAVFTIGNLNSAILTWGFMSLGLRSVILFFPMCGSLFFKGKVNKNYAVASSCIGIMAMLAGQFMHLPFDSLFLGLAVSLYIMIKGLKKSDMKN